MKTIGDPISVGRRLFVMGHAAFGPDYRGHTLKPLKRRRLAKKKRKRYSA